jgi:xylulokinase
MSAGYLVGVDIGTYSSKGVLVTTEGRVVASHTLPHTMSMPRPGFFEHDADGVWWHDFVEIIRNLLKTSGINPNQILGIGTSAIGSCVLPIDEKGRPLRPGILYGIDTRASKEIEYLENKLGRSEIFLRSGSHLSSQASGPKVLWIKNNEPEVYEQTRWFLTSEAYLVHKLTGNATIDIYTAAGYAPLYDVYNFAWLQEAADLITPLERLPQASWSYEIVGEVTAEAARATGLVPGTPVVAGTTDAAAEAISAGVEDNGDMMLMFGSSIFFIMKTSELTKTEHFWSSNFLEKGTFAFLGGMSTSGSLTTWFRDQFMQLEGQPPMDRQVDPFETLARMASESPAGSHGLVLLPYFEGERTPLHDPKARGLWFGLSLKHNRGDLYRSILEGVAFGIRHNMDVMGQEGVQPKRVLAVGGGTKNPLWLQIVADVCNLELHIPEQQIGASYGDAFLAATGIGLYKNLSEIKEWVKVRSTVVPKSDFRNSYEFNYQLFRELYLNNKALMHKLSDHLSGESL